MSAFEADRFNHSRTSPRGKNQLSVVSLRSSAKTPALVGTKTSGHLPAIAEEALQHLYATAGEDASFDLHAVVQLRVVEHLQN